MLKKRLNGWGMGVWLLALASAAALGQETLFQTSFKTDNDLAGWRETDKASVSPITRRAGTRSLMIAQWDDAEQDSHWLSPVLANPDGGPVKISFWAADNYRRQDDFSYAACLNTVTVDEGGQQTGISDYLVSMAWDDSRKWDELWGQLTTDGLAWKYYEVVATPGKAFRLKFHWPKPIVRGECYLTDLLVVAAAGKTASEAATATASAMDAAPAVRTDLALELSTPVQYNIYYQDAPLQFEALVYSTAEDKIALPADAKLVWKIRDFQRFFLARGEQSLADAKPVADPAFYKSRPVTQFVPARANNVTKSLIVDDPKAKPVGQLLFLEAELVSDGRTLARETMPFGVVNPRKIDPRDYPKCRFVHHWWNDSLHFAKSQHQRQALADKLGVSLAYGHAPNWKASQPTYPGPYDFGEKHSAFPKRVLIFNLEQERGQKADAISWGTRIEDHWTRWAPAECIIDDPLHPGCLTFKIEPYVELMVEYIRHNRDSIAMVVPSGLERSVDARTIELHKKAYTAIKKEFPDLPVGYMIYGLFMNPSLPKQQFVKEDLFDYADFIDCHLYASSVDWTEWEDLRQQFAKRGRDDVFMISTEMAIVSGAGHVPRAKGTIAGSLDSFAHNMKIIYYFNQANHYNHMYSPPIGREIPEGSSQGMNFLHMQLVARPKVSPDISMVKGDRWVSFQDGGASYMPVLQTMAYYNTAQNYEAADFRETRNPDAECVAQVFDRRDATVVGLYLKRPVGFRTYAVKSDTPFTLQDMFGRNTSVTPLDGTALISVNDDPATLIFDKPVEAFDIVPVTGGAIVETLARGGKGNLEVAMPGVFEIEHDLRIVASVDGTWPESKEKTLRVEPGQTASVAIPVEVDDEREVGDYPLTTRIYANDKLVGMFRSGLKITERLRLEVDTTPLTRTREPAIQVAVISLHDKPVKGVVRFEDRIFVEGLVPELREAAFEAPANGRTMVTLPVPRDRVNLTTSYRVSVSAETESGTQVKKEEEIGFRACEKASGPIVVDGDLSDWNLAERTPFTMARTWTTWGKVFRGPDDLDAKVYTVWDDKALYFAAVVTDDCHVNKGNDISIWLSDNIHLGLHPWGWKLDDKLNTGYYREHLGLCEDGTARIFRVGNPAGGPSNADGASIAVKKTTEGYIYEWAYPLETIFPMQLAPGKRFRLSMGVWDRDWVEKGTNKVVRGEPDKTKHALNKLGGLQFGNFLANIDSRPEKWREFVLTD